MTRVAVSLIVLLFGPVDLAGAQSPTGAIGGVVTDTSGAAVTGVQVRITHRDAGRVRTVTTSTPGSYTASALLPGMYTV